MGRLVVLHLGAGNLDIGFSTVICQLWDSQYSQSLKSPVPMIQVSGSLPACPSLADLYQQWQQFYHALYKRLNLRRGKGLGNIELEETAITNISPTNFDKLCETFQDRFNNWLKSDSFRTLEKQLLSNLHPDEVIRVIVEVDNEQVRRLPWHCWECFIGYPKAEIALALPDYELVKTPSRCDRIRILAILGNSQGIDVEQDRQILKQIPNTETVFLVEPERQVLNHWLWDDQGWDILYFAGHSSSHPDTQTGTLEINQTDSLTIDQLRHALRAAISQGLQLAIFNSCDGLGLARALADLHIPQLIVMREPVADLVAQEFLKSFLIAFQQRQSIYLAVKQAREKLQGLEDNFPAASWLPIICQNPAAIPFSWEQSFDVSGVVAEQSSPIPFPTIPIPWQQYPRIVATGVSFLVTLFVVIVRLASGLQQLELKAFDHFIQLRKEAPDPRLLLITITENDISQQSERQGSLSNRKLEKLLNILNQYQPAVIGLDIYRDFPIGSQHQTLINAFQSNDRFLSICKTGESQNDPNITRNTTSIPPSNQIPHDQLQERVGFSDVILDPDGKLRRQLLGLAPPSNSTCQAQASFSFLIALRYLTDQGIEVAFTKGTDNLQLGNIQLKTLEANAGGYHGIDAGGYQMPLNYRATPEIATQLTLEQALDNNQLSEQLVKDRIVLIGTVAESFGDRHLTPYSQNSFKTMPGIVIQAHMVSQILSAVLDHRPLIWWWPEWGNMGWIGLWSLLGGLWIGRQSSIKVMLLTGSLSITILYGCCYLVWLQGGWIPLVPSGIALLTAVGTVSIIFHSPAMQVAQRPLLEK